MYQTFVDTITSLPQYKETGGKLCCLLRNYRAADNDFMQSLWRPLPTQMILIVLLLHIHGPVKEPLIAIYPLRACMIMLMILPYLAIIVLFLLCWFCCHSKKDWQHFQTVCNYLHCYLIKEVTAFVVFTWDSQQLSISVVDLLIKKHNIPLSSC